MKLPLLAFIAALGAVSFSAHGQDSAIIDPARTFPVPGTEDIPREPAKGKSTVAGDVNAPGERVKVPVVVNGQEVVLNFSADQLEKRLGTRKQTFEYSQEPLDRVFAGLATLMDRGFEYPASLSAVNAGSGPAALAQMTLSARYVDMTPSQVFYRVARSYGFAVRDEDGVLRLISPASLRREDLVVKVYTTKYVNLFNFTDSLSAMLTPSVGKLLANAMRAQKTSEPSKLFGQATSGAGDVGSSSSGTSGGQVTVQSDAGRRDAVMPNNAHSITVVDLPEVHAQISEFLSQIDRPKRQIAVSFRLYSVRKGNPTGGSKTGMDLSSLLSGYKFRGKNGETLNSLTMDPITGSVNTFNPAVASGAISSPGMFTIPGKNNFIFSSAEFDVAVNLIETTAKGLLRQNSNVIAQHGVTTFMRDVTNVPFVNSTTSTVAGAGSQEAGSVQYLQIGTILNVTGWIEDDTAPNPADWTLYLDLKPEISASAGSVTLNNNATPIYTATAPTTQVRIRNGDTVFLGGLTSNSFNQSVSGVPFLSNIPVLGYIFGSKSKDGEEREMAMMVTAEIIDIDRKLAPVLSKSAMENIRAGEETGPGFIQVDAGTAIVPERPVFPKNPNKATTEKANGKSVDAVPTSANPEKTELESRRRAALRAGQLPGADDSARAQSIDSES